MKWAFILLISFANVGFANDTFTAEETFTLEESKRIARQVETAVKKKYTTTYLKQIEQAAISKYKLYKVGDKFTAMSANKPVRGTLHKINQTTIQVGDFAFYRRDYPAYHFDKHLNGAMRKAHIKKNYYDAKIAYEKRAETYYIKKIVDARPKPALIVKQPTVRTKPNPQNTRVIQPRIVAKQPAKSQSLTAEQKTYIRNTLGSQLPIKSLYKVFVCGDWDQSDGSIYDDTIISSGNIKIRGKSYRIASINKSEGFHADVNQLVFTVLLKLEEQKLRVYLTYRGAIKGDDSSQMMIMTVEQYAFYKWNPMGNQFMTKSLRD